MRQGTLRRRVDRLIGRAPDSERMYGEPDADRLLIEALGAAFGSGTFMLLDVVAVAFDGDMRMRAALHATGMRSYSGPNIGRRLAILGRTGALLVETRNGKPVYRVAPETAAQDRAGATLREQHRRG